MSFPSGLSLDLSLILVLPDSLVPEAPGEVLQVLIRVQVYPKALPEGTQSCSDQGPGISELLTMPTHCSFIHRCVIRAYVP